MRILITGACGHIGSYIIENIHKIKKVKKVILLDNFLAGNIHSVFNLKNRKKFVISSKDLTIKGSLNSFKKIDIIIHCASITNAAGSFDIKDKMFKNNLGCMKNVINYCNKNKTKLIHFSSTSVYGKQTNIVDEECEKKFLIPQSPYAEIKLIEENMLKKNSKNFKYNTFRLGTIGGISKGMRFHTAINQFCLNASLNSDIKVYKGAYDQYRPYLTLRDTFKTIKFVIENNFFKNDIFNILSNNYTVRQIINIIKRYKPNLKIKFVNTKMLNQLSYKVKKEKIEKFGLKINSNIEKDIKNTLDLF
tara:strand:- start:289 stop:1203 length:915 start_codon:yes stop_codon:yes gene_type:complete